jgi:MFS family permease
MLTATPTVSRPAGELVLLPMAFAICLVAMAFLSPFNQYSPAALSAIAAGLMLGVWQAVLLESARRRRRNLTIEVAVKKQHWLQACAQGSVLVYWGWYWPTVYQFAPFIVAQLLFAYAFDMLLSWTRRDHYSLGFAPFPVIFSINLFLWFRPEWFYLQFLMVAVGMAAKELIRWERDGKQVHIFNPSSFPLAVFSIALLATGTSGITYGESIANTQWFPPQIYLFLFLIGLPGQFFFGVTSMTMSAVVSAYLFSVLYLHQTGVYFFYASYIPISVFLGMHLLFTDPSTSPRTELGRIIFGIIYGLSMVGLYQLLTMAGMPRFYDKLLQVPVMNLSVKAIDRAARSRYLSWLDPAKLGRSLLPRQRNLAYISIWAVVFAVLSAVNGVGDSQPGQWLPFWKDACDNHRATACAYLSEVETAFCSRGSAWACTDAGIRSLAQSGSADKPALAAARRNFSGACRLGYRPACENLERLDTMPNGSRNFENPPPTIRDYPVILQGFKGPITERDPAALYALACKEGWKDSCGHTVAAGGM